MSSAGHWETEKGGKHYYCMVSGGYAMVGVRINDKTGLQLTDSENSSVEGFASSNIPKFVKQNMGDKIYAEVQEKVNILIALRNKKTAAPAKES